MFDFQLPPRTASVVTFLKVLNYHFPENVCMYANGCRSFVSTHSALVVSEDIVQQFCRLITWSSMSIGSQSRGSVRNGKRIAIPENSRSCQAVQRIIIMWLRSMAICPYWQEPEVGGCGGAVKLHNILQIEVRIETKMWGILTCCVY